MTDGHEREAMIDLPDAADEASVGEEADPETGAAGSVLPVVCVGASAGGLEPLQQFFGAIPPDTGAAFVLVLHLSPDFKTMMPELLSKHTAMPTATVEHNAELKANAIHLIPASKNMVLSGDRLLLSDQDRAPGHPVNSPIDIFLESLAREAGPRGVAVILSGTGSDGSRGIEKLKDAGGFVLVQDPSTAKFDGMPISAINTRSVDRCAEPKQLATMVTGLLTNPITALGIAGEEPAIESQACEIVDMLRHVTAIHFGYCRETMVMRRVRRRMALVGSGTVPDYIRYLRGHSEEVRRLGDDLLIGVTSFFRDPLAFESLKRHVTSALATRTSTEPYRVWVPACASGEEVYSLAMLIMEAMEATEQQVQVKIFATDLDEESLARASAATYTQSDVEGLGKARLARYFVHRDGRFTVNQAIRDMVICARQNLIADPPFTKIDLVSCRNFLIYAQQHSQELVLSKLHFALRVNGLLFLGTGESLGRLRSEFEMLDPKAKIFRKTREVILQSSHLRFGMGRQPVALSTAHREQNDVASTRRLLETLAELDGRSVAVLDLEGTLVDLVADPLGIFRVPRGSPTTDVMKKLVSSDVAIAVATGLHRLRPDEPAVQYGVESQRPGSAGNLTVKLRLMPGQTDTDTHVLFVVEPAWEGGVEAAMGEIDDASGEQIRSLRAELLQTQENLQATIEELQTTSEEQQSTNEELVASNEEMQSTNEELLSVNEELSTVNLEYEKSNKELEVLATDLSNLLNNIDVGTIFLNNDLQIRKFTPTVCGIVKLVEHDIGRSIEHFQHYLGSDLLAILQDVQETGLASEQEFRGPDGRWYLMRVLPYMGYDGVRTGVLLTFVNVTALKNAEETMRMMNDGLASANRQLSEQREELEDLFSIVAHDLKRPVVALDGLLKLTLESTPEERADLIKRCVEETGRMRRMLVDLGHMSTVSRQRVVYESIEVKPWLMDIVEGYRERAGKAGVLVNCMCDRLRVHLPHAALEEVIRNLVENAFNYGCTGENPQIDISCELIGTMLRLTVRDNGAGIAPRYHEKVFEPFRRLSPEMAEGSGIGLVAVRRLLGRIGAAIELESDVGHGAKFVVNLPVHARESGHDETNVRALIVEDDAMDARLTQRLLGASCQTTVARTLAEAIELVEQDVFDVIFLDLSLGDGHGLRLVARLRELRLDTPVIILSGHCEGITGDAMLSSVSGFIDKSNMNEELVRAQAVRALSGNASGSKG